MPFLSIGNNFKKTVQKLDRKPILIYNKVLQSVTVTMFVNKKPQKERQES